MGNFNGAMAIALALDSKPISRLMKVWRKVIHTESLFELKVNLKYIFAIYITIFLKKKYLGLTKK